MAKANFLLSIITVVSFIYLTAQQGDPGTITCYGWTGREYSNNTQCPGSYICCNEVSQCTNNRFCEAKNQTIVPACSQFPWNDCANICQYDPGTGLLPRAFLCSDGSYCCDNEPSCCADNEGIVLNALGGIVSTDGGLAALSTSTSSSSSSSATAPSVVSTTSASTRTTTATSSSLIHTAIGPASETPSHHTSTGSTISAGAIAGISIMAVGLLAGLGGLLFWVGRRRGKREQLAAHNQSQSQLPFEEQRKNHASRHFLHGTPMYRDVSKTDTVHARKVAEPPREMYAGTPDLKR